MAPRTVFQVFDLRIRERVLLRETEHFWIFAYKGSVKQEKREQKSRWFPMFDTPEAAWGEVQSRANDQLLQALKRVDTLRGILEGGVNISAW